MLTSTEPRLRRVSIYACAAWISPNGKRRSIGGGEDAPGREIHQHLEHLASFGVDAGDHAVPGRAPRPGECAERAHEIGGHQKQAAADGQGGAAAGIRAVAHRIEDQAVTKGEAAHAPAEGEDLARHLDAENGVARRTPAERQAQERAEPPGNRAASYAPVSGSHGTDMDTDQNLARARPGIREFAQLDDLGWAVPGDNSGFHETLPKVEGSGHWAMPRSQ